MTKNKIPGAQLLASITTVKTETERTIAPFDHKKSKIEFSYKFNLISPEEQEIIKYHLAAREGLKIKLVVHDLIEEGGAQLKEGDSLDLSVAHAEKMEAFIDDNFYLDPKMQMVDTIGFIKLDSCAKFVISVDSIFKIDSITEPLAVVLSIDNPDTDYFRMEILNICSDLDPQSFKGLIEFHNNEIVLDWEQLERVDKIFISVYSVTLAEDVALS